MTTDRAPRPVLMLLATIVVMALAACAAGPTATGNAGPSPSPSSGGPVTSREQAVERVIQVEPRLTGIGQHDPDMIGQSSWFEVVPGSGVAAFIVTIRVGWGDCEAGCINEHSWVYGVGPDGTVRLQSEAGAAVPAQAWPSPGAAGGGGGGQTGPGIQITATAGPTCPVETVPPDPACAPRPVGGATIVIQDAQGNEVAKVSTDPSGVVFVPLSAGAYLVRGIDTGTLPTAPEPQKVVVEAGQVAAVVLAYDTGIR
jgi:hypothetical protein